jgi:hypothetical protein
MNVLLFPGIQFDINLVRADRRPTESYGIAGFTFQNSRRLVRPLCSPIKDSLSQS